MKLFAKSIMIGALTLCLSLSTFTSTKAAGLTDIQNHPDKEKIEALVEKGVITGFSDNTFRPDKTVTRAEFAAFIARALELPPATPKFKDVSPSMRLYNDIGRASAVGIINGYPDGTFRPDVTIERQQMAIMLHNAMEKFGDFHEKDSLSYFSDSSKIGASAREAVSVLSAYEVMGRYNETTKFEPAIKGTRLSTVLSIYALLNFVSTEPVSVPTNKTDKEMTYFELIAKYGEHNLIRRINNNFVYDDLVRSFMVSNYDSMEQYIKDAIGSEGLINYEYYYPTYEMISYNGKAISDSPMVTDSYAEEFNNILDEYFYLPFNPKEEGQFMIDVHSKSLDYAEYLPSTVKTHQLKQMPYETNGIHYMDVTTIFKDRHKIEYVSDNKVKVDGNTITLSGGVKSSNGVVIAPVRELAEKLGYDTYMNKGWYANDPSIATIKIANFSMPEDDRFDLQY